MMPRFFLAAPLVLLSCTSQPVLLNNPPPPAPYGLPDAREPATPKAYKTVGTCGGLPRIDVSTAPGFCVGLVDNGDGLLFPRGITSLNDHTLIFADMGGWVPNRGKLYLLTRQDNGTYKRSLLMDATTLPANLKNILDRPNALLLGPDGQTLYVGSSGTIFRFRPLAPNPLATVQVLIDGLPNTGRHPLKALAFDNQKRLYVNIGTWSDNCEDAQGKNPNPTVPCLETDGSNPRGVIRRYTFDAQGKFLPNFEILARGLRNSMALAYNPDTNELYQGENSRDFINSKDPHLSDLTEPPEELNLVEAGAHYGWPYCYGKNVTSPEYRGKSCASYRQGLLQWPAHASPLSMYFSHNDEWPAWYQGKLIVAFHGYREFGHRIVAFDSDSRGRPTGDPMNIVYGWEEKGTQPMGAPTSLGVASDGSVFITEDKNKKILRLFYDRTKGNGLPVPASTSNALTAAEKAWRDARTQRQAPFEARLAAANANPTPANLFTRIQSELIHSSCLNCHAGVHYAVIHLLEFDDIGNAEKLLAHREGSSPLVIPGQPDKSEFLLRLQGKGSWEKMPPMGFPDATEGQKLSALVREWIEAGAPVPTH
ncbi:MAG: PQQ-dependent sugar dehydrogenase [Bdellovibrionales bacterium]|nr:PQQ-dependent sugar dehydrogenase [Bdellovibrionales bacterium]